MTKQTSDHGIVLDEQSQEQPKDKERARTATKTSPEHMPPQSPAKSGKDDELQPLREKSGF